jgi:hypothetical protein
MDKTNGTIGASFVFTDGTQKSVISPLGYNDNNWHHLAVTCANGNIILYIDASQVASNTGSTSLTIKNTSRRLVIGGFDRSIPDGFNGSLSDIRIWDVTRTQPQIALNYQIRLNGNELGLISYWKLDQETIIGLSLTAVTGFINSTNVTYNAVAENTSFPPEPTWSIIIFVSFVSSSVRLGAGAGKNGQQIGAVAVGAAVRAAVAGGDHEGDAAGSHRHELRVGRVDKVEVGRLGVARSAGALLVDLALRRLGPAPGD